MRLLLLSSTVAVLYVRGFDGLKLICDCWMGCLNGDEETPLSTSLFLLLEDLFLFICAHSFEFDEIFACAFSKM